MKKTGFVLLILLFMTTSAFAKAYFAGKKEMIQQAQYIVLVNISKIENVTKQGNNWIYRQKASGTVEQCLKGEAAEEIEIYGMESFICAQSRYEKGRVLLFLRKDGDLWCGSNWHLGVRPVYDNKVQWFKDDEFRFEFVETSLEDVISDIRRTLHGENNR